MRRRAVLVGLAAAIALLALTAAHALAPSARTRGDASTPPYRTFYISYASGSESNGGASKGEPWQRAPGMNGFSASYTHKAGDHFIFEGGVTWPHSALPLAPPEGSAGSGEAGDPDVYGVDESWYAGARYERPIFDADDEEVTAGCSHERCSEYNALVDIGHDNYITIEGIHFVGWANTKTSPYGTCAVITWEPSTEDEREYESGKNITIDNVVINDFTVGDKLDQVAADEPDGESEGRRCAAIVGRHGTNTTPEGESVVEDSTIEGIPSKPTAPYGGSWVEGIRSVPNALNDTIKYMNNMYFPGGGGGVIAGNRFEDCGYPEFPEGYQGEDHANVIEFDDTEAERLHGTPIYIYDNVIDGSGDNGHAECESSFLARGEQYVWNNVYLHVQGNPLEVEAQENHDGKDWFFNNTLEGAGLGRGGPCIQEGHGGYQMALVVVENNLCIGDGEVAARTGPHKLDAVKIEESHNLLLTPAQAQADGYTTSETFAYSPASERAPSVGAGINLSSWCSSSPLQGLCQDTDYGGARQPLQRPASGAWDIGAYQFAAGSSPPAEEDEDGEGAGGGTGTTSTDGSNGSPQGPGGSTEPYTLTLPATGTSAAAAGAAALRATIVSTRARESNHRARIRLACSGGRAGDDCRGVLSARFTERLPARRRVHGRTRVVSILKTVTLGRAGYAIPTGTSATVALPLSSQALALLEHAHGHSLRARVTATLDAGQASARVLTLRLG